MRSDASFASSFHCPEGFVKNHLNATSKSFLCAGGEASKDTCTGGGGGPLISPTSTGQFIQVGIISWGIGCGQSNIPAVYVDVAQHRPWIDQQLANYGVF